MRGVFDRATDRQAALGFNFIDSSPYKDQLDQLARRRLKGFIWLGGYSNENCRFRASDSWVRSRVGAVAGHRAVGAYFIDDEPDAAKCPRAPADMKARSALVRSLDPRPPTFLLSYRIEQYKLFKGSTDVLALDKYPCSHKHGCDYARISQQADEADRLGIRYWGVIQAYGDDWYRQPTRLELHKEFACWRTTNMEGYLVFAWRWPRDQPDMWLAKRPDLQEQLRVENGSDSRAPAGGCTDYVNCYAECH